MEIPSRSQNNDTIPIHVLHKVPSGNGPYVRAKHAQIVEKDPEAAIIWFWEAINARDKTDSALKDMAMVMKQMNRTEEAIQIVKSVRTLCPKNSQESIDSVLMDLYKRCGKVDEQIAMLKHKLKKIFIGETFNGRTTKAARSHGKKFQVSVKQETSRLLGNLGWAYMQKSNYIAAEVVYRKAQMVDPDANKALNLCHCLIKQGQSKEAASILDNVFQGKFPGFDNDKSRNRAEQLASELKEKNVPILQSFDFEDDFIEALQWWENNRRSKRLPIFKEISQDEDDIT